MKASELRALTIDKLNAQLIEKSATLNESRRTLAAGELANPRVIRNQRREIALLKTVIAEQLRDSTNKKENDNV
ncbi:50S ribosomal protein L29 [Pedobacter sp.]|nr:50S ribosomal protein L29 [Candidatus Saccharibacteria bacterium]